MRQGRFASCKIFHSVTQLLNEGQPRSRRTRGRGESASRLGPVPSTSATFLSDGGGFSRRHYGPRDGARRCDSETRPASAPGPSQVGPHRVAAESHRHPRGQRPAEQPPCRQHRGAGWERQAGNLPLSPSRL